VKPTHVELAEVIPDEPGQHLKPFAKSLVSAGDCNEVHWYTLHRSVGNCLEQRLVLYEAPARVSVIINLGDESARIG
jgi:hypothetical protein